MEVAKPKDARAIAKLLGCTGYRGGSEELFIASGGICTLGGQRLQVYTFATTANRDLWTQAAVTFGPVLVGDLWTAAGPALTLVKKRPDAKLVGKS